MADIAADGVVLRPGCGIDVAATPEKRHGQGQAEHGIAAMYGTYRASSFQLKLAVEKPKVTCSSLAFCSRFSACTKLSKSFWAQARWSTEEQIEKGSSHCHVEWQSLMKQSLDWNILYVDTTLCRFNCSFLIFRVQFRSSFSSPSMFKAS